MSRTPNCPQVGREQRERERRAKRAVVFFNQNDAVYPAGTE